MRDDEREPLARPGEESVPASAGGGSEGAPGAAAPSAAAPAAEDPALLRDRWLRAEADLQNFRRRAARELEEARRAGEESVMQELIAALDDLERALAAAAAAGATEAWTEGVRLVGGRLADALARQGVTVLDPLGQPFDPAFHEAILEMPSAAVPAGHVAEVVLKGWRRGDRALRAARVVVSRGSEA